MKFAFLIQRAYTGGLASMHTRMKEALERRGHEVDKLVVQEEDVIGKVEEGDYDVVHLYFTPFLNLKFFVRILKLNLTSSEKVFVNYYNIKPENLFRRIVKRTFLPLLCTLVVLPSENMENFYREEIGIDNTATLRPIVEEKFYEIESEGDNIIYFGHSRPDKGIDRLIEIASEDMKIHTYFIQDRERVYGQHPEIEQKIEEGSIVWRDEMPEDALREAKVSLFPFHHLQSTVDLPLALIESLAAGIPVLTSDIAPVNEYLPEEFLVEDWSRENIEQRIEKIDSDFYREKARNAAEDMEVDESSVIDHYMEIIREA
ncbi:MAG: glycosyltransferase [Candidatus Nanohaloarchaea archaeon]